MLYDAQVDAQYASLKCDVAGWTTTARDYKQIAVARHQEPAARPVDQGAERLRRAAAARSSAVHDGSLDNQRLLFHGSRIQNWVGILSRGILLPKVVVKLGVGRTDAGWLGNGIYFGDAACTSCAYTSPGKQKTRFMAVARVALGQMKDYTKITYGL